MRKRPILFSAPMVRAILAGKKTQTRRLIKNASGAFWDHRGYQPSIGADGRVAWRVVDTGETVSHAPNPAPYCVAGDRLWVRETTIIAPKNFGDYFLPDAPRDNDGERRVVQYLATHTDRTAANDYGCTKATPSIFMPRWASRITLEVTSVRVERLQDIGESDAEAEGVDGSGPVGNMRVWSEMGRHRYQFAGLWDAINGKRCPWSSNPWVWVVSFRRVEPSDE